MLVKGATWGVKCHNTRPLDHMYVERVDREIKEIAMCKEEETEDTSVVPV